VPWHEEAPTLKNPRGGTKPVIPDERQISFSFLKFESESDTTEHHTSTHASTTNHLELLLATQYIYILIESYYMSEMIIRTISLAS
jgi:hypothetical protein